MGGEFKLTPAQINSIKTLIDQFNQLLFVGERVPDTPVPGMRWFQPSTETLYYWDGNNFINFSTNIDWNNIQNKPTTFPPSLHGASAHSGFIGTLSQISDVTISATNLNSLDDGANSTLHYHDSDRDRANQFGTQAISTVSGLQTALDGKANISNGNTVPTGGNDNDLYIYDDGLGDLRLYAKVNGVWAYTTLTP